MSKIFRVLFIILIVFSLNTNLGNILWAADATPITNVILDTDMGADDWMSILWLLNQKNINVKAITICTDGEAISPCGAQNATILAKLVKGDSSIKIYNGKKQKPIAFSKMDPKHPIQSAHTASGSKDRLAYSFPKVIRSSASTDMKNITGLKGCSGYAYEKDISAAQAIFSFAIEASNNDNPLTIISTGTATNIAEAFMIAQHNNQVDKFIHGIKMIYKGGGAFGLECNKDILKPTHFYLSMRNSKANSNQGPSCHGDLSAITERTAKEEALRNQKSEHNVARDKNRLTYNSSFITNLNIPGNLNIGGIYATNNTTAEWNIYTAAESMQKVLNSGLPVTFIPLNVSNIVKITKESFDRLRKEGGKLGKIVANIIYQAWVSQQGGWAIAGGQLDYWDPSVVITALHPEIILEGKTYKTKLCVNLKNPSYSKYPNGLFTYYGPNGTMNYRMFTPVKGKFSSFYYGTTIVDCDSDCKSVGNLSPKEATVIMGINPDALFNVFIDGLK
jgi:inosine-uridine nucleoside N-ribohydrolase